MPDSIHLYRLALCEFCEDEDDLREEVLVTVVHEVAHHFGIDDDRLTAAKTKTLKVLRKGDYFGEMALLSANSRRAATCLVARPPARGLWPLPLPRCGAPCLPGAAPARRAP